MNGLLRDALARSTPALGTWVKIPAMEVMELVALAGFDFAVIDLEHAPIGIETAYRLIGTALHTGVAPVVRLPGLDPGLAQRLLDAGAEGIMIPHVDTVAQARAAVNAVRFPPLGARGVGSTSRAGAWGALPRDVYLSHAPVLITQIESAEGVRHAGAIAAVEGVDALLVGAADLSVSLGLPETDPTVRDLIAHTISQARDAGLPIGNAGNGTAEAARASAEAGFTFTMLSNDASLLGAAARAAVEGARAAVSPARVAAASASGPGGAAHTAGTPATGPGDAARTGVAPAAGDPARVADDAAHVADEASRAFTGHAGPAGEGPADRADSHRAAGDAAGASAPAAGDPARAADEPNHPAAEADRTGRGTHA
ncbi:HpcH/HpaI aldolase family protein [Catenuloplanes japonicus]|uniref:HpcH/HpaI aldolase family protein n=1 Tax=Catenuloplanes japonicus TaxID=33876 RepID=UPI000690CBFC|nr:aldolase/citrate lyase family protein [Catenuloplanes japonicus]